MKIRAILLAFLAALFYSINIPLSKILLNNVSPTILASLLYLGAGIGIGIISLFNKKEKKSLEHNDLIYTVGMIFLDILAPIFLMLGLKYGTSSNASLLGNFEIVSTALIALLIFKEGISKRLWIGILFITLSSILLSFEGVEGFKLSYGSIFVLLATICWGLENNCTRKISDKNTFQIVILKGVFSGLGALIIALLIGEVIPNIKYILLALSLGFLAYGLSIFMYVKAQNILGAAKTSAYYAINPFIGALLSFIILHEALVSTYIIALIIMIIGASIVVIDTLIKSHEHEHSHVFIYNKKEYTIRHNHRHKHIIKNKHKHSHKINELLSEI